MPMLTPTKIKATVRFLGINDCAGDLSTNSVSTIDVDYGGFVGDSHSGVTRASCVRVVSQYPKGTQIRNTRQISALSSEELESIRNTMELDTLNPEWVGANLVLEGIPEFSKIPPSSRLIAPNGTSLVVDMENAPCRFPGDIIEQHRPGFGVKFPQAALNRRGVTLWVEHTGVLKTGDKLTLHIPPVCSWRLSD
ncbi:MAG: MOSC domain-containing protein [Granulosicoccus sp.]